MKKKFQKGEKFVFFYFFLRRNDINQENIAKLTTRNRREMKNNSLIMMKSLADNHFFSRVLRDSTPRYVAPSVGRLVG